MLNPPHALAWGGGPRPQGVVEGRRAQTAGFAAGPSTIRFANGPPPQLRWGGLKSRDPPRFEENLAVFHFFVGSTAMVQSFAGTRYFAAVACRVWGVTAAKSRPMRRVASRRLSS